MTGQVDEAGREPLTSRAALQVEVQRLRGQVAAIRALPWATFNPDNEAEIHYADGYNAALADVRAALVASSPTTPEAKK